MDNQPQSPNNAPPKLVPNCPINNDKVVSFQPGNFSNNQPQENNDIVPPSMLTGNVAVIGAILGNCPNKGEGVKNRVLAEFTEEVKRRGHRLEEKQYYFGMLSNNHVASYLKKTGDFGIYATDNRGAVMLQLTVRGNNGVYHYDLIFDALGRGWNLKPKSPTCRFYKTIIDLVEFHKTVPLPIIAEKICLVESLNRPRWFLKHENVKFNESDMLGRGNFCEVFRGTLVDKKIPIAVKVCHANWKYTDGSTNNNEDEQKARESLVKEGAVMAGIEHGNVITFHGICCDHPPIMIALELCPGGSLLNHLINAKAEISIGERVKYMFEAAAGMASLQKNNLIHRDLAARNCLISAAGHIKIADFGLSKLVSQLAGEQWNHQQIPVRWMAPETLRANPDYSIKSDVWSYGVLLFEILNYGEKPWPDWENKKIATYIRRGNMPEVPGFTPPQIRALVQDCWKLLPQNRPDFNEIHKRINEIQGVFPSPKPDELTLHKIKGVNTLNNAEADVYNENIEIAAMTSSMSNATSPAVELPPSVHGIAVEKQKKDATEDNSPTKDKKKKKKKRDVTKDTHDETAQASMPKTSRKKKKKGITTTTVEHTREEDMLRTCEEDGISNNTVETDNETTQEKGVPPSNKPKTQKSKNKSSGLKGRKLERDKDREGGGRKNKNEKQPSIPRKKK